MAEESPVSRSPELGEPATAPPEEPAVDVVGLQRRARRGVVALVVRTVLMQLTVLGGDVFLRRQLTPADFGLYAIVQFALGVFLQFGDVGLASALIRQRHVPTRRELSSAWAFQMLISLGITVTLWVSAPVLLDFWPDMSREGIWVLRALSLDVTLASARLVPSLLMERDLEYSKLSALDVCLSAAYYVTAITLAATGFGIMSLAYAVLARSVCGVIGAYLLRPFLPQPVLDWPLIRPIMHFGVRFQLKSIVGYLCFAIAPIYAGRTLGQAALGFINLGQSTAQFPLRLVEVMARVSFPLFSRLQGEPKAFAQTLQRGISVSALGTLFFVGLIAGLGPNLLQVVYGPKWMPSLYIMYIFAGTLSIGFLHPVVAPAFDALGKPGLNLRLMVSWTIGMVITAVLLTPRWGTVGFTIGICLPGLLGNVVVAILMKRLVPGMHLWPRMRALIAGSLVIAALGYFVLAPVANGPLSFGLSVLACVVVFLAVVGLLDRSAIEEGWTLIRKKKLA